MEQTASEPRIRPATVLGLLGLAIAAAGLAACLILIEEDVAAGAAVAVAAAALVVGGLRAREDGEARLTFADSLAERLVDAIVFGAFAWEFLGAEPRIGAAALTALSASYVAAYIRAKATGLGFEMGEPHLAQPLRMAAVSVGLFVGAEEAGLWAAAALSLAAAVARSVEVFRRRDSA